jgi:hypothetical protein
VTAPDDLILSKVGLAANALTDNPAKLFDEDFKDELCKRLCDKFIDDVQEDYYQVGDHKK